MRKSFSLARAYILRSLFTATILLAMALTLSCSSDGDDPPSGGTSSVGGDPSSSGTDGAISSSSGGGTSSSSTTTAAAIEPCPNASTTPVNADGVGSVTCGGKPYKTIKIGEQVWFAVNLNYAVEGSKCGGDDGTLKDENTANCDKYGRLYDWETATKVCPTGWHLPSNDEWGALMQVANPSCPLTNQCNDAGKLLKATAGWTSGNGTDDLRFSALPGGYSTGVAFNIWNTSSDGAYWWSATEHTNGSSAYFRSIESGDYVSNSANGKSRLYSVRCLKDN